jgi:anti-sigma B factor antagonist
MENSIKSALVDDGTAVVVVQGEIDFANADELADGIRAAVSEWSPTLVRIDLTDATFIDSTGLGALIEGYRAATGAQAGFVVVNPSPTFHRVLIITGLCDFFGLPDSDLVTAAEPASAGATSTIEATGT